MTARQLVALATGFALAFVACAITVAHGRSAIDLEVATWMAPRRDALGTELFVAVAYLGSVAGIVPLGLVIGGYLKWRMGWRPVCWLALAMVGASLTYGTINLLFHSERPPLELRAMSPVGYSFPSGHAAQTVAFWITAAILVGQDRPPRTQRGLRIVGVILALATACSRIYLGVHWTFDVLGGLSLGAFWTCCVLALRVSKDS